MAAALHTATLTAPVSLTRLWAGRLTCTLAVLFLVFDGGITVLRLAPAVEGSRQLGYPAHLVLRLGLLDLACLLVYLLPRTAVLGALLLTGYLGGAVATQVRGDSSTFSVVSRTLFGGLLWGGLVLRDARLRALLPLRR